ncbi:MAG TPA: hypothetical protein PKI19_13210 [Elusimicrobiales bacterium]|nr:hypothetical protein [Elusimicrobiales bacterium]
MKKILKNFAILAAAVLTLALCLEGFLRVRGGQGPLQKPLPLKSSGPVYTILCVGDSFTFGAGAPPESSYPRQLESILTARFPGRAFKVVNFGQAPQSTEQLLQRLNGGLDDVNPAAVILLCGTCNFMDYRGYHTGAAPGSRLRIAKLAVRLWRSLSRGACREMTAKAIAIAEKASITPVFTKTNALPGQSEETALIANGVRCLNSGSHGESLYWFLKALKINTGEILIYQWIADALGPLTPEAQEWCKLGAICTGGASAADFSGGLDIGAWVELDLNRIIDAVQTHGGRVLMQNYPSTEPPNCIEASTRLRAVAIKRSMPFVDQASVFDRLVAQGKRDKYFARGDPHCSADGNRLVAEQLADALVREGFIQSGAAGTPGKPIKP